MTVVAVLDADTLQPAWPLSTIVKIEVKPGGKLPAHPIESGALIYDHFIQSPNIVTVTLFMGGENFEDAYREVKGYFDRRQKLVVQGRVNTYNNMIVCEWPHEETADVFDATIMTVQLQEVPVAVARFRIVKAAPRQKSKIDTGQQQPKQSALKELAGKIFGGGK